MSPAAFTSNVALKFDPQTGLLPAVVQDADTGQVLMLGYVNEAAWAQTQQEGRVTFFSRSKNRLWTKGETSGNFLSVVSLHPDCDFDAVLIRVRPAGPTCHRGTTSCFEQADQLQAPAIPVGFLVDLERVIRQRHDNPASAPGSYTVSLFEKGLPKIAQKVGEEAIEIVIEAKDNNDDLFLNEGADLLFHYLILLQAKGFKLRDVIEVLKSRHSQ